MSTVFHLKKTVRPKSLTKKPNVLFEYMLTISKITKTIGSLKQKL
jgi:hypothetical protein